MNAKALLALIDECGMIELVNRSGRDIDGWIQETILRAHAAALEEIERLKANRDNWMESCKVAQGHRDGANAQILLLEQEVERLKGYLCAIFNKLDTYPPHAPGHCHSTPGIWDADNDSAIAGKGCEWCAKWGEIRGTLRADKGE